MDNLQPDSEARIALFQRKEIRRTIHNDEWWFVITDVVAALTDSVNPQGYVKDMRRRDPELSKGWGQIAPPPFNSHSGWSSKPQLRQYRRALSPDPVHPQSQG